MANARYRKLLHSAPALLLLAALANGAAAADAPLAGSYTVCLQPLGEHEARLLPPVADGIAQVYGFAVRQLPPRPLPEAAYTPARKRYRADRLLDHLRELRRASAGCKVLVGFTSVDISTTKGKHADWGVLGLSYRYEGLSVVSTFRMRNQALGGLVMRRAQKVVLHEIGHAIGLPHRNDGPECLMNDANGAIASIDRANGSLCLGEREAAEALLGFALPKSAVLKRNTIRRGGKD
jgi:archaemetzincin